MDVFLDSNIYVNDFRMAGSRFSSLFDYLRKVDSSLILPSIVLDEVSARFKERFRSESKKLEDADRALSKLSFAGRPSLENPEVDAELRLLQKRMKAPSDRVKALVLDDY